MATKLTVGALLARFAFALLVAGVTYNPTRYSYYAWAERTGWQWRPLIVFVGVVLLIHPALDRRPRAAPRQRVNVAFGRRHPGSRGVVVASAARRADPADVSVPM